MNNYALWTDLSLVPVFDMRLGEDRIPFPTCLYDWDKLPRYPFDDIDEEPGKLVDRLVLPFYTVNMWTNNLGKDGKLQQGGVAGGSGGYVNNVRISYNLIAVGVVL